MAIPYQVFSTQSVNTQSIQYSGSGTVSQPRSPQANQLTSLMLGGGLAIAFILLLHWFYRNTSRRLARSQRNSAPIDWYQAEFGCDPSVGKATTPLPADPVKLPSSLQSASEPSHLAQSYPDSSNTPNETLSGVSQEPTPPSLSDRYSTFIHQVIIDTLAGKVRSKDFVYDQLVEQLQPRTGEIFERCLMEKINTIQHQLSNESDELKRAKAERQARALNTLQDAWERWQQTHQAEEACNAAVEKLVNAEAPDRLTILLQILDPNQAYVFNHQHIESLAKELDRLQTDDPEVRAIAELHSLSTGLKQGLLSYSVIEPHLVGWLYERPAQGVGFGAKNSINNPWNYWAKHVNRPLPQLIFAGQALNHSAMFVAQQQTSVDISAWVELMVLLRGMQNGLIVWFDKQPYSSQVGQHLAAATFLSFAMIWCELSNGFHQAQQLSEGDRLRLARACFQITLQILRAFAQRDNFPLYGGIFASFSGETFRDTVAYLDQPLKALEKNQEKARILTVLGYSQQWIGNRERAKQLYQEALDLAHQTSDQTCAIANLNHLSRLSLSQREFAEAINYGQRALLLARQIGDSLGEANAIANLGYAEVRQLTRQEHGVAVELEDCIQRLERGLKLAEKHRDGIAEAFCALGLGLAYLNTNQTSTAKSYLDKCLEIATRIGNLELEGLAHAMIAEVNYQLNQLSTATIHACLGTYLLEQKQVIEWRQAFNLIMILQGRLGDEAFKQLLQQQRSQLIAKIGVDGFDHLLNLLSRL